MEIFQKSFLSILLLIILLSCENNKYGYLTVEERKQLANNIWHEEVAKHGFNGSFQGTPKAETLLDQILELDPNSCDAIREKSVPYLKRGIPNLWKPLFDKAVECDPIVWQPWRGYLYLYFYRNYDKAIADFNASDILTPNFIDAPQGQSVNYWRGLAYLGKSDFGNSIRYLETHISIESKESGEEWVEPSSFLYLGIAQYELGEIDKAELNLKKMLDYSYGNSADANYYLAKINFIKNDFELARQFIQSATINYEEGYFRYRDYVEEIRQIYPHYLDELRAKIDNRATTNEKQTEL